jgi:hypothetical protein
MWRPPSTATTVVANKSSQSLFTLTTLDQRLDDIIHIYTPNDGIVIDLILRMLRRTRWGHRGYCIIHREIVNFLDTSYYGEQKQQ